MTGNRYPLYLKVAAEDARTTYERTSKADLWDIISANIEKLTDTPAYAQESDRARADCTSMWVKREKELLKGVKR